MKLLRNFTAVFFILFLIGVIAAFILIPDKAYSSTEKRNLSQLPSVSLESITDGSFMDAIEDYTADQFPLRDTLMKMKTGLLRAFGKNESQGVYIGKNDTLMERFDAPQDEETSSLAAAVNAFADRYPDTPMYFLLAPNAISVYSDLAPANALTDDQDIYIETLYSRLSGHVTGINVAQAMWAEKDNTLLYYRTDHHWTTDGAYVAFRSAAGALGLKNLPDFNTYVVSNAFTGSLVSESGFSVSVPDAVKVAFEDTTDGHAETVYTVTYPTENKRTATCYSTEALVGDDPYEVFFGGNYPLLHIETSANSDRSLLIIKDSYANSFIPFLIPEFKKITVLDPRYYYEDIDALMGSGYTDVLFLYNVNTLSEDSNLATVLNNEQ